jgi:hypothetical protein
MARVKLGLMPLKLKQWPHQGPMVLREGSGARIQYHVIDGWQHLATFDGEDELASRATANWRRTARTMDFNIDGYRILTRHLAEARLTPLPSHSDESDQALCARVASSPRGFGDLLAVNPLSCAACARRAGRSRRPLSVAIVPAGTRTRPHFCWSPSSSAEPRGLRAVAPH